MTFETFDQSDEETWLAEQRYLENNLKGQSLGEKGYNLQILWCFLKSMAARGGNPWRSLWPSPWLIPRLIPWPSPWWMILLFLGVEHMRQTHLTRWNHHYQLASHFGNCSKKELIISYNCIGLPCKAEMIKIMTLIIILQTNSVTTTITQGQ